MTRTTIAARLKRLRGVAGVSARDLANLAGLASAAHVSLIENGTRGGVQAKTVEQLARVLGVSMDWLFTGRGEPPSDDDVRAAVERTRRAVSRRTGTEA